MGSIVFRKPIRPNVSGKTVINSLLHKILEHTYIIIELVIQEYLVMAKHTAVILKFKDTFYFLFTHIWMCNLSL